MPSDKPRIMFRADEDVAAFIESIPEGTRSVEINIIIRRHMAGSETLEERVNKLEKRVKSIEKKLA